MPELPQMQALAERLDAALAGAALERADLLGFWSLKTARPQPGALVGSRLAGVGRRGKFALLCFGGGERVALHLSQGGRVDLESPPKATRPRGALVRFTFGPSPRRAVLVREHGTQRKAGWWVLAPGDDGPLATPGPEPGDAAFARLVREDRSTRRLYTWLRDQRVVAGVGRGYTDDALNLAGLSPFATVASLDAGGRESLLAAVRAVLDEGLGHERRRRGRKVRHPFCLDELDRGFGIEVLHVDDPTARHCCSDRFAEPPVQAHWHEDENDAVLTNVFVDNILALRTETRVVRVNHCLRLARRARRERDPHDVVWQGFPLYETLAIPRVASADGLDVRPRFAGPGADREAGMQVGQVGPKSIDHACVVSSSEFHWHDDRPRCGVAEDELDLAFTESRVELAERHSDGGGSVDGDCKFAPIRQLDREDVVTREPNGDEARREPSALL